VSVCWVCVLVGVDMLQLLIVKKILVCLFIFCGVEWCGCVVVGLGWWGGGCCGGGWGGALYTVTRNQCTRYNFSCYENWLACSWKQLLLLVLLLKRSTNKSHCVECLHSHDQVIDIEMEWA